MHSEYFGNVLICCKHTQKLDLNTASVCRYLGSSCRNQPYSSHISTTNSFDFLNVSVAFLIHQLEREHRVRHNLHTF